MMNVEEVRDNCDDAKMYQRRVITRAFEKVTSGNFPHKIGEAIADGWNLKVEFPPVAPSSKNPFRLAAWFLGGLGYDHPFKSTNSEIQSNPAYKTLKQKLRTAGLAIASVEPYQPDVFFCGGVQIKLRPQSRILENC